MNSKPSLLSVSITNPLGFSGDRIVHQFSRLSSYALCWVLATITASHATSSRADIPAQVRTVALTVPGTGNTGFTQLDPSATGVLFTNTLSEVLVAQNRILENGSGVALGDFDGDGWCDIYLCSLEGPNVLYRNLGNWKFEDVTEKAGVACFGQFSTGAVFADINGNSRLDLLVNGIGVGTRLFLNQGDGRFQEFLEGRLVRRFGATSMALADLNGNGLLDLYVTNYRTDTYKDRPPGLRVEAVHERDGTLKIQPPGRFLPLMPREGALEVFELGERDFLYLNQGNGVFAPVSWTGGGFVDADGQPLKEAPLDWGLAVQFRDLNGDGTPDLYVCNDFAGSRDRIWLNENSQRLRAVPPYMFRNQSLSSMAVDMADIDRDGFMDIFVGDMLSRRMDWRAWQRPNTLAGLIPAPKHRAAFEPEVTRNTLHRAWGDGTFAEIACYAGLAATDWTWSVAFLDVDLDGWEDLLIANGNGHDVQDADVLEELARLRESPNPHQRVANLRRFSPLPNQNLAFRNQRDLTFADRSTEWGFDLTGVSTGMAFADLDNDGDLDVVLNNLNGTASLYRNNTTAPRIAVQLKGRAPNTQGIGARIRVRGGPVEQSQEMISGGRYCSGDQALRMFASGSLSTVHEVEVTWRSGIVTRVHDIRPNTRIEIIEPDTPFSAPPPVGPGPTGKKPLFVQIATPEGLEQDASDFEDWARQPLLPRRLSTESPTLAWWSHPDPGQSQGVLILSTREGTRLTLSPSPDTPLSDQRAILIPWGGPPESVLQTWLPVPRFGVQDIDVVPRPGAVILGASSWKASPGSHVPGVVLGEASAPDSPRDLLGYLAPRAPESIITPLPALPQGGIPLALTDLDGNGAPELFVGGRAMPGNWPRCEGSHLLRRDPLHGGWQIAQSFPELQRVTGAVFSDINSDGYPDLIVACEWGSPRLYLNRDGTLVDATQAWHLDALVGPWTSVAVGDFNNNGLPDIVLGNWGHNFRTDTPDFRKPLDLVWGWDPDFGTHAVLATPDPSSVRAVPWRDWRAVTAVLPGVANAFPTHRAYSKAAAQDLFKGFASTMETIRATEFASLVLINEGNQFSPRELPPQAQWTSVQGIAVADLDGDGNNDIILAQNFFGTDAESHRLDAGRGLVLLGRGDGTFQALAPNESGLRMPGEGRGIVIGDFDRDGRPDIAIAQQEGPVHLYQNQSGPPRFEIHFDPIWPGTSLRPIYRGKAGAFQELRIGDGTGSVSLPVFYLGTDAAPVTLEVRIPGREVVSLKWPNSARVVRVRLSNTGPTLETAALTRLPE